MEVSGETIGSSKFGSEWGEQKLPVVGIVGAIDDVGDDAQEQRIGLSAMQLTNIGLKKKRNPKDLLNLQRSILRNTEGLTDDDEYSMVVVKLDQEETYADAYNASGKLTLGIGSGIRVSKKLADELGLKIGSKLVIDKPKDVYKQQIPQK
ncbi:MAG: hypothetical protein Q7R51_00885 [bacterium]|nr:hypothetical protein [bacterium]